MKKAMWIFKLGVVLAVTLWLSPVVAPPVLACAGYCPFYQNATRIDWAGGATCQEAQQELRNKLWPEVGGCPLESHVCNYRVVYTQYCYYKDGMYVNDGYIEFSCYYCQQNPEV